MKKKLSLKSRINELLQKKQFKKVIPNNFLEDISGKVIKINLTKINIDIIFEIKDGTIILLEDISSFDVEFEASPVEFLLYISSRGSDKFSKNIIINGDINTANKLNRFMRNSDKFKEIVANIIGKESSVFVENLFMDYKDKIKNILAVSSEDLKDFFMDDLEIIPNKNDINRFLNDVDDIKARTDKILKRYNYDK